MRRVWPVHRRSGVGPTRPPSRGRHRRRDRGASSTRKKRAVATSSPGVRRLANAVAAMSWTIQQVFRMYTLTGTSSAQERRGMPTIVDRENVQRLRDEQDAQLVDVLPADEYDDEHIA